MPCAIVALLSLYLSFLYLNLLVQTQSRPYGLCHRPCPLAHIKVFGSSLSTCLCLLVSMLYACVGLSCSRLCHVWYHQRVCSYIAISDAHEAFFRCNHLGCIATMPVALCIPFPFFTPYEDVLIMLVCATRWLSLHLYTLAYMSMHESCLLVCRTCFNTMKIWTSDPNLHLSLVDTAFSLLSFLFVFLFVCLLSCYACYVYHAYLLYAFFLYSLHLFCHRLSASFLSLTLYVHTQSKDAQS